MFIDTHAHLNLKDYKDDADGVIKRALENDVWMINAGVDFETSKKAIEIAEKFPGVYAAVGFHPNNSKEEFNYLTIKELALNPKVVAIGETGLDYYRIKGDEVENKNKQKEIFKKQIELAFELKKPLIIHCRDAHDDLSKILKSYFLNLKPGLSGVLHSFSGNIEQAGKYRKMGFKIAFNGIITFSRDYDEVILKTPIEDILIETDCPFLTPVPHRGKRNEPLYVIEVAKKLAEIKTMSLEKIGEQTTKNAKELFGI
ncbi:MAG: TatD family hydrolase [Candidatus Paceibacterota bacterium]